MTHQGFSAKSSARLLVAVALLCGCGAPATLSRVQRGNTMQSTLNGVSSGEVVVVRPGVGPLTPLPRHLQKGDQLSTGPTTSVMLRFANSAYVLVEPSTSITISSVTLNGPTQLREGESRERPRDETARKQSVPQWIGTILVQARTFFRTGTAWDNADVPGTRYRWTLDANGHSVLQTFEGTVTVSSRSGAWASVDVHAGESITTDGASPPEKRALTPDDVVTLDLAFEAFDRLLDLGY